MKVAAVTELRERLERETSLGASVGDGWWPYIEAAATLLDAAYPGWKSGQIKEKFGGLRFYITPAPYTREPERGTDEDKARWEREWYEQQEAIATAAERACQSKCEICGDAATTEGGSTGWIHTLCPVHQAQYEEEKTMGRMLHNA